MTLRHRASLSRLLEAGVDHQETIDARWTDLIKAISRLIWRRGKQLPTERNYPHKRN